MALAVVSTPMQSFRSRLETTLCLLLLVESTQSPMRATWPSRYHQLQLVLNAALAPWARAAMAAVMACLVSMLCTLGPVLADDSLCVLTRLSSGCDGLECLERRVEKVGEGDRAKKFVQGR